MLRAIEKRKDLIKEFFNRKIGLVGVAFLIFFLTMSLSAPIVATDALNKWNNAEAWKDNPTLVPPTWYLKLINAPNFPTNFLRSNNYTSYNEGSFFVSVSTIEFNNDNNGLPTGFVIYITYEYSSIPLTSLTIERPDGNSITIQLTALLSFPKPQNATVYTARLTDVDTGLKIAFFNWLLSHKIDLSSIPDPSNLIIYHIPFSKLNQGIIYPQTASPLNGKYRFIVNAISDKPIKITNFEFKILGNSFGIMGTDGLKRDVWAGLLWGAPIAFMIGLLTSLISLVLGLVYGAVAGYYGKRLDEIMMRIVDVLISIPVLPILILFLAYFGRTASIWVVIFLISIFGWMGIARVVRSTTLQLKATPFIEAVKAAGASSTWIMFKHIIPQMMPFAYANLALGVPSAILTEAGLSFLGLGDPTLPTWGQILNHAESVSAVQFGYWWLWLPPGLLIAGISLAFVFIGHALDEVLNPRIRRL